MMVCLSLAAHAETHLEGVIAPDFSYQGAASDITNRWGEAVAALSNDPRPDLLRQGVVQRLPEEGKDTEDMRSAEAEAIAAQRGLWVQDCCKILSPDQAERHTQSWRVVRGRVTAVKAVRDVTFVNFGADWKKDFTLVIPKRLAQKLMPETWVGKTIESRGWIYWTNGAAIDVSVPEQIRLPESANQD